MKKGKYLENSEDFPDCLAPAVYVMLKAVDARQSLRSFIDVAGESPATPREVL
jgi:hypothetical protein